MLSLHRFSAKKLENFGNVDSKGFFPNTPSAGGGRVVPWPFPPLLHLEMKKKKKKAFTLQILIYRNTCTGKRTQQHLGATWCFTCSLKWVQLVLSSTTTGDCRKEFPTPSIFCRFGTVWVFMQPPNFFPRQSQLLHPRDVGMRSSRHPWGAPSLQQQLSQWSRAVGKDGLPRLGSKWAQPVWVLYTGKFNP